MLGLFFFFFGLIIGSFLNVCTVRIPAGESIVSPPSHCPQCKEVLPPWDLVPVVSYLHLRGRCRYCGEPISIRYPLIELFTGLIFFIIYFFTGWQTILLPRLVLASILITLAVIDLDTYRLPNPIVFTGMVAGIVFSIFTRHPTLPGALLGFLAGGVPLYLIAVVSKGGMGGGDMKLGAMIGLYLGWQNVLLALFLASLTASVMGIVLMAAGRIRRRDPFPFGPFLAVGTFLVMFWGEALTNWYLSIFW